MAVQCRRRHHGRTQYFVLGLCVGFILVVISRFIVVPSCSDRSLFAASLLSDVLSGNYFGNSDAFGTTDKNLVLVGVMTAKPFLRSRVIPAFDTWAAAIPGKVIFFSSEGSVLDERPDIPLVSLQGVDDSYPPQRKSFMMLKYMHDNFGDRFRFFMRADDDIYINGDVLRPFLHSINSSDRALYIGQAGLGNKEEFGQLSLRHEENFCMGGPGMILNRETLVRTVPHVNYCLRHLLTAHEDVEVGRCIARFAGVSCTWAYEMQKIMYNNYREPKGSFTHSLRDTDIHRAATLHPVKNASYQYRIHQYFRTRAASRLRNRLSYLQRQVNDMNELLQDRDEFFSQNRFGLHPSLTKTVSRSPADVTVWDFLSSHSVSSSGNLNPKRGHDEDLRTALGDIIRQVMESINQNARQRGRVIDYKDLLYGYRRLNPLHGADYMLDLLLVYRKFKGKRKMTVPVRRHAYLQQAFLEPEFREFNIHSVLPVVALSVGSSIGDKSLWLSDGKYQEKSPVALSQIHFILPIAGRYKTFLRFMDNLEDICLSHDPGDVTLVVVLFKDAGEAEAIASRIAMTCSRYPNADVRLIEVLGPFSRGVGLQRGSGLFSRDALLVFIDVDVYVTRDTLERIRLNTVYGRRVYYPIVFSQFDPQMSGLAGDVGSFESDVGYWRNTGFGIVAVYNGDFIDAGGFDLKIRGWGREDVDLMDRFVERNVTVFRAVDVGLVHVFHQISCDPSLKHEQYQMCLGSKAASFASVSKLTSYVRSVAEIYQRNDGAEGVGEAPVDVSMRPEVGAAAAGDESVALRDAGLS